MRVRIWGIIIICRLGLCSNKGWVRIWRRPFGRMDFWDFFSDELILALPMFCSYMLVRMYRDSACRFALSSSVSVCLFPFGHGKRDAEGSCSNWLIEVGILFEKHYHPNLYSIPRIQDESVLKE